MKQLKVKDMGNAALILSINISRDRQKMRIAINQENYIKNLMKKYDVSGDEIKRVMTPAITNESLLPKDSKIPEAETDTREYQALIGELNWLVRGTRPQNCYATNRLAQSG